MQIPHFLQSQPVKRRPTTYFCGAVVSGERNGVLSQDSCAGCNSQMTEQPPDGMVTFPVLLLTDRFWKLRAYVP